MQLDVTDLIKRFKSTIAVNIPHLSIHQQELVGIVGNNGAGKTTLFRLCLDLLQADNGEVKIDGEVVSRSEQWKTITSGFIDERFLVEFLTPMEYFYFVGQLYDISNTEIDERLKEFHRFVDPEMLQTKKKYIRQLSKGNKQKIGIIGAMITHPQLLILDEPFNYLDPSSQMVMKELLVMYNRKYHTTILLSSHNLQYVMDICSRVVVLDAGHVLFNEIEMNADTRLKIENHFLKGTYSLK